MLQTRSKQLGLTVVGFSKEKKMIVIFQGDGKSNDHYIGI